MTHLETHGPQADDDILQAVTAMMDIQLAMEARTLRSGKGPTGSQDESTVENILRNAVIASREYQLEDMLELYDFAELLVEKLKNKKAISGQALDEAAIAFAGLLHWLWSVQNLAFLAEEMIQGQTGVLQELLHSLRKPWKDKPWFERLRRFEQEMQKELDSLEGLPYDDKLYPRIDEVMAGIQKLGTATLEEARQHSPDAFCQTTVWLLGCLIKHNTYSFVDGSVPEDLNEKLKKVLYHFEGEAEGNLYPWLDRGFKSVREAEIDELQRWKYGFAKS